MLVDPCCCNPVVTALPCCPCDLPEADFTVSWLSSGNAGDGSAVMIYYPGPPALWRSTCVDLGTVTVFGSPIHFSVQFQIECDTGSVSVHAPSYQNGTCSGSPSEFPPFGFDVFTCTPFHRHTSAAQIASQLTWPASPLYDAGFTSISFDSPNSTTGTCVYIFDIVGCNSIPAPGTTVNLWTSSAKTTLIGTRTGSGSINGAITANGYYEVTGSRFLMASGSGVVPDITSSNTVSLTEASGYFCDASICGWPLSATLHSTHPVFGALTYTYSSGSWVASKSYSYPGNVGGSTCAAKVVTVTCTWDGGTTYYESWPIDGSGCPDPAGAGGTATAVWIPGTVTCYQPSVTAFDAAWSFTPSSTAETNMYGTSALALDLTE